MLYSWTLSQFAYLKIKINAIQIRASFVKQIFHLDFVTSPQIIHSVTLIHQIDLNVNKFQALYILLQMELMSLIKFRQTAII